MPTRDIIVIGASAGGIDALKHLVRGLPAEFPAALFVVVHVPAHGPSVLPKILSRAGRLPAVHPVDGQPIEPGHIYIAPPDLHLLVKPGHVRLARGPRENSHRPAADPLFRTAAHNYGPRVIGLVLSGVLDDGTAGLQVIKRHGGVAVVQDPDDALYDGMPRSALAAVEVDYCVPVDAMPALLARLAAEEVEGGDPLASSEGDQEAKMAELEPGAVHDPHRPGTPSGFGCPECGGVLWRLDDGSVVRFRCRVGHAWSAESLLAEQSDALESALWTALRALEEQAALNRQMAERTRQSGHARASSLHEGRARDTEAHAEVIRRVLLARRTIPENPVGETDGPAA